MTFEKNCAASGRLEFFVSTTMERGACIYDEHSICPLSNALAVTGRGCLNSITFHVFQNVTLKR
ncbi:MAG: hypothetical protein HFP81_00105 [Methylococcales symbiont of Hymedesmia sp. n. MRB-2018]|nr:MAG: hypothetical protein HFP81_00105 [Methylococcales symbiont of Hymedesmia sp. n. MRB-2018]